MSSIVQDFISDVCKILNIKVPIVSYDTSHFPSSTTIAQCDPNGSTIFLREYPCPDPDQFFSIAHELRHIWQKKNNDEFFFSNYRPIDMLGSSEEYNLQIAEIDANAFAGMVMADFFHLQPLYTGLSPFVIEKIHDRMEYLASTEFKNGC